MSYLDTNLWFPTQQALAQHNEAKHGKLPETVTSQSLRPNVSTPVPLLQFRFKDESYKYFPLLDLTVIHHRLILKCHSFNRLRKECYILPSEPRQENWENRTAPYPSSREPKRKAVALDCEMAGVRNGDSEIISICVIDFFSGQVLTNSLVKPHEPIIEWRTNIHGIRPATLSMAVSQGQALRGWEATRQELFKHINTDTVLVGQSLNQDLKSLRISHGKIFDTAILTAEMVFGTDAGFGRRWSLQSLYSTAAREVALWCLCYPHELEQWGKRAREKYIAEKLKAVKGRRKKRGNVQRSSRIRDDDEDDWGYHYDYGYDGDDILRWEDVVDWEIWPKSPPSD
ncbi:ribonuclease H-like domain-containing protein [Fusarium redolens]|uniref:Ribonuclease H-like domain-containing protein n=1 Tax=Fusarium redolens TaxID=48865 RepID=A0A9P9FVS8_FUSRE|nr:ribonuclease H-like domain-containing protein [Fusarium redolens]KAH7202710.1 ribonuclease H-like domain-containing protein [Fusarium redolens]